MISSIINFLASPLGIAILIGVFSAASRGWVKVQEQRARKLEIQQRRERERDALRTGRSVAQDEPQPAGVVAQARDEADWDEEQRIKRERLEQLRRIRDQRMKARAAQTSATTAVPAVTPQTPQQQRQQQPKRVARPKQPPRSATPQQRLQAQAQPQIQPQAQRAPAVTIPTATPRRQRPKVESEGSTPSVRSLDPIAKEGVTLHGTIEPQAPSIDAAKLFQGRAALRNAIIAQEVLSPPLALR